MSRDDESDDFINEDDESDDDEDEICDDGDDTGLTGYNHSTMEDTRMSESNKLNTEDKPAPKAPPARRAPMGLLGTRPAAQAAKPQPSTKPTTRDAVPPPVEPAAPPTTANLAKADLGFTEDMFATFLKSEGTYQIADYAKIKFAGLVVMVQKWVAEAIETNVPPVDGWHAAVRKLEDTADAWLRDEKCDELTAKKIKVLARFVSMRVEALSAFEEVKPAPAKKAELSVAPLANPPAKVEKVESKPAEPIAAKNPMKERACKPSNPPPPPAKQITDPTAATEIGTPMPGPSRVTTGTGGSGGRTTITPEDQAKLAEVAAKITDEVSASIQAPPMSGLVKPVHPEAKAAVARNYDELSDTNPPADAPRFDRRPSAPFSFGAPAFGARAYPFGEDEGSYPPAEAPAPAPAPAANPEPVKETKQSGITMKQFILMALVFMLGMVVFRFVIQDSPPAAPSVQAATPTVTSAPAALAPSTTETCAKVTPALLQQHYGQGDPSAFRFEKKAGVRMDCKGKTIYKNPSTGLFNVQPCDICYSR